MDRPPGRTEVTVFDTLAAEVDAAAFDFDVALSEAQERFDRKARVLSAQDEVVARLQAELDQAQRAHDEVRREYEQAAREEDDLMAYLGVKYDYAVNETRYFEYGE